MMHLQKNLVENLVHEMKNIFGSDQKRIAHAMNVYNYAEQIRKVEGGDPLTIRAAALLHDIGILEAERKHDSAAGKWQELEGPPIAGRIMKKLDIDDSTIKHVCRITGSHHSAGDIDTLEFRILWDADWLVNIPDEMPDKPADELSELIPKIFKTAEGMRIARHELLES